MEPAEGNAKLDRSGCLGGRTSTSASGLDLGALLNVDVSDSCKLKFTFVNGSPRAQSLDDFSWEKSAFSKKFRKASTPSEFVSIWAKHVFPNVNKTTGTYQPSKGNKKGTPSTVKTRSFELSSIAKDISLSASQQSSSTSGVKRPSPVSPAMLLPSSKKAKDDKPDDTDKRIEECFVGCFEIPVTCLKKPDDSRCLREPDRVFIDSLKNEMMENPTSLVSPIVGLVRMADGDKFDHRHPQGYMYETIGGNNSRIALQELVNECPEVESFKTRLVAVYVGLTNELALRLASKHNRATGLTHSMTTQDKVATCRKRYDDPKDKHQWRKLCAAMLCEPLPRLDDSMVLFLSALPQDEYDLVLRIFEMFEACELKDQKLSRAKRGATRVSKLDCKGGYFKPLRGIEPSTRKTLLLQLVDGELSFADLANSCRYAKRMRDVQDSFMRYLDLPSWEVATDKYPDHTRKQRLEPFLDMAFKPNSMPASFVAYCQHAKEALTAGTSSAEEGDSSNRVIVGSVKALLFKRDVLVINTDELLSLVRSPGFGGFSLTIIDPPKEWSSSDIIVVCRLVRSINAAMGLQTFNIAILGKTVDEQLSTDFKSQIVYFQDKRIVNTESTQLSQSVSSVVLYHWTSSGEIACYPRNSRFEGNLLTVGGAQDASIKAISGRAEAKPEVYAALVELLTAPGQWVFDPISGQGKASSSTVTLRRNAVLCDSDDECMAYSMKELLEVKTTVEENASPEHV